MDDLKNIIAANICALRRDGGITQYELAEKLNYTDKAVSKWERGESIPDVTVLKAIADLFGVTVDYLLTAEHTAENKVRREYTRRQKRNQRIIATMSAMLVWLIATFAFVNIHLIVPGITNHWLAFVYAVPVTAVVLLVFNCVWGGRKWRFFLISLLMWSTLLCIYLTALTFSLQLWLIFALGIPGQIIILLWAGLKLK